MASVINIATSGLQAASQRLAVSANNVANATTSRPTRAGEPTPDGVFAPQRTVQTSIPGGGVREEARPIEPATVIGPDISSPTGLSSFPNVNLLEEYLEQKLASISYTANASVIRTQQELDQALLDIET